MKAKSKNLLICASITAFIIAVGVFIYTLKTSKALSYLSSDPKVCINCHVMNPSYATWQKSSHARVASCVDCHLPRDNHFKKYLSKAKDGWNHSIAFTFNTYGQSIKISDDGAKRVQANCVSCHSKLTETLRENRQKYLGSKHSDFSPERKCWDCHQEVPHGKVRSLTATPNNLGVR